MEQKKTLWIIAAVSVFLLVVMGAAMILYNPGAGASRKVASIKPVEKSVQTSSSSGWTNSTAVEPASTSSPQVSDMFVVSENTTVLDLGQSGSSAAATDNQSTTIDLNALKRELAADAALAQTAPQSNINITVNLSDKENTAKVEEPPVVLTTEYYTGKAKEAEETEKATAVKKTETAVAKATTTSTPAATAKTSTSTASKSTSSSSTSTKTTTAKATASTAAAVTRFWVQVAAYSNKKTAENARSVLSDKKINSDIYTYEDAKSKLFYRVRVGPFTTKSEAEYWQSKIVEIADFAKAGSYVTSTVN
ncbi:MAG: SPOR domain-containing protein [Treponema sp.]|nr:SPOR domain-containing protein [Treponema sp.]